MKSWRQLTYIELIFGDPQGILGQQLRLRLIHLWHMIIILISYIIVYYDFIKLINIKLNEGRQKPKPEIELLFRVHMRPTFYVCTMV